MAKHHYVPQMYLNNFGEKIDKDYRIYAYDIESSTGRNTVVRKIAQQGGFHDIALTPALDKVVKYPGKSIGDIVSIEEGIGQVESTNAQILRKLLSTMDPRQLTIEERRLFAFFVGLQLYRVPRARLRLMELLESEPNIEGKSLDYIRAREEKDNFTRFLWSSGLMKVVSQIANYLNGLRWVIRFSKFGAWMHTSDNPVFFFIPGYDGEYTDVGIKTRFVQTLFPLSRFLTLTIYNPKHYQTIKPSTRITIEESILIKKAMKVQATRYLYAYTESDLDLSH